jgi:hypothetical protein
VLKQFKVAEEANRPLTGDDVSYGLTFNVITMLLTGVRGHDHPDKSVANLWVTLCECLDVCLIPYLQDFFPLLAPLEKKRARFLRNSSFSHFFLA